MATSGELARIMAYAIQMPHDTVSLFLRKVRLGGLIAMKGHGRSAARMEPLDAARLLLAVVGGLLVKDAVETVGQVGGMRFAGISPDASGKVRFLAPEIFGPDRLEACLAREMTIFAKRHGAVTRNKPADVLAFLEALKSRQPSLQIFFGNPESDQAMFKAAVLAETPDGGSAANGPRPRVGFSNRAERDPDLWRSKAGVAMAVWDEEFVGLADYPRMLRTHSIYPQAIATIALLLVDENPLATLDWFLGEEKRRADERARVRVERDRQREIEDREEEVRQNPWMKEE